MPLEFARLTSAQLLALPKTKTAFFFPVGPLEDHGPHLPLGMDLMEANELCRRAAIRLESEMPGWTAIILPPAPLGLESNTQGLALTVRAHVLRDWLVDACRALSRSGFVHFICFSGHLGPKQLTAIEEAGMMIYKRTRWIRLSRKIFKSKTITAGQPPLPALVSACSATISASSVRESPFFLDTKEHGGRRDTSVGLAIDSTLVDEGYKSLPTKTWVDPSHWNRAYKRIRNRVAGYWGSPANSSAGWGQGVLQGTIDEIFPKLRAVLEGADPNLLFRSWYSVFPPNRTFFKSWIIALSFLFLFLIWIFINLTAALTA